MKPTVVPFRLGCTWDVQEPMNVGLSTLTQVPTTLSLSLQDLIHSIQLERACSGIPKTAGEFGNFSPWNE